MRIGTSAPSLGRSFGQSRGLEIECGCFGGGGYDANATGDYPWEIARDVGLLLASAFLVVRPRTRRSLDALLFRTPQPVSVTEGRN